LFVLAGRRSGDALMILVLRCLIVGSFAGLTTLLFSLAGGLLAWGIMLVLMRWEGRAFSLIGISLAGAAAHNIGHVLAAVSVLAIGGSC
jgi:heptaprenyl diphosphate synthase